MRCPVCGVQWEAGVVRFETEKLDQDTWRIHAVLPLRFCKCDSPTIHIVKLEEES